MSNMHGWVYRNLRRLWPGGIETQKHLRELKKMQWLSHEEMEKWQLERIQHIVKYAYENIPFYRERYGREDIHPEDIRSFKDFQALPFLTKQDVNSNRESMVAPQMRKKAFINMTGGSTGESMRFYIDNSFWWWNQALEYRCRGWYGVKEGDKLAWCWGDSRDMYDWNWKRRLKAFITQQKYLNAYSLTEEKMRAFAEMLVEWRPIMVRAYVSALELFARYLKDRGIFDIRPKLIETTAEIITVYQRELFEEVFGCPVADCYTGREFGTIAYECEQGRLHVCETRFPEIIVKGRAARPGELGEVALTSLSQYTMPFIRYKNDDMAILDPEPCPCGRGTPVYKEIVGRIFDFLVSTEGKYIHSAYLMLVFNTKPEVVRFQAYQPDKRHLDIQVVCKEKVTEAWKDEVIAEIQSNFGKDIRVAIDIVDHIELTRAGKHRFVISDVKPDFL